MTNKLSLESVNLVQDALIQQRPIVIVGGAVGDIVLALPQLPYTGQDVAASLQDRQIGGCAFNIARVLSQLGLDCMNGIPVGNGSWARLIEEQMARWNMPVLLKHPQQDNGWCIALVEDDGERTFISVEGCETDWDQICLDNFISPENSIIYCSGYELSGSTNKRLQDWLIAQPASCLRFIDPGPRIDLIDKNFLYQLLTQNTILSINKDEIALMCRSTESLLTTFQQLVDDYSLTAIARFDSQGAWLCKPQQAPSYAAAYKVPVVDTIGAGDSHSAGVIAGLALGYPLIEAIQLANKIAAMVVNRRGADNPPTWQELADFEFIR